MATKFFASAKSVGAATGADFPDALSAAAYLGGQSAPLLLIAPAGTPSASVVSYLASISAPTATVFGGQAALSDDVVASVFPGEVASG